MPSGIYLARVKTPCGVLTERFFGKISNEKEMLGNGFKIEEGGTLCVNVK